MNRLRLCSALVVAAVGAFAVGCTAKTVSPPLSRGPGYDRTFAGVFLTSGEQPRAHHVIGHVQMTQTGFKWMHEIELVEDSNPASLLYRIGEYARKHGANGVQHLQVIDLNPQTPAETGMQKVDSVIRMEQALRRKDYAAMANEGTETRWEIRGELIVIVDRPEGAQ
jgi:hypothetical protein